jgi:hypothetical protein
MPRVRTFAETAPEEKRRINDAVDDLIATLAAATGICREAVANVAFYRLQRHPGWGRNASKAQKRASHTRWKGTCKRCNKPVAFAAAKFHHLKRGIPDQHAPGNLVPEHLKCHDSEHSVKKGSLTKGSPTKRTK